MSKRLKWELINSISIGCMLFRKMFGINYLLFYTSQITEMHQIVKPFTVLKVFRIWDNQVSKLKLKQYILKLTKTFSFNIVSSSGS